MLKRWAQNSRELSNKSLEGEIQKETAYNIQENLECMEKALQWSVRVNEEISSLEKEERRA